MDVFEGEMEILLQKYVIQNCDEGNMKTLFWILQTYYSTERFICHWSLSLSCLRRPFSSFSKYSSANKWMGTMSSLFRSLYRLEKHTNKIKYTALATERAMLLLNQLSVLGKMAHINLRRPIPVAELSPTETAIIPVMSPCIECGVWANTNSLRVMTESKKPSWFTLVGNKTHQRPSEETLNISECKNRHVTFVCELHNSMFSTSAYMINEQWSSNKPNPILFSIVGMQL